MLYRYGTTITISKPATKVQMEDTKSIRKHSIVQQVKSKTNSVKIQVKCVRLKSPKIKRA